MTAKKKDNPAALGVMAVVLVGSLVSVGRSLFGVADDQFGSGVSRQRACVRHHAGPVLPDVHGCCCCDEQDSG